MTEIDIKDHGIRRLHGQFRLSRHFVSARTDNRRAGPLKCARGIGGDVVLVLHDQNVVAVEIRCPRHVECSSKYGQSLRRSRLEDARTVSQRELQVALGFACFDDNAPLPA